MIELDSSERELQKRIIRSGKQVKVSGKDSNESLILDPSFFSFGKALSTFLESKLWRQNRVIVPSRLYYSVQSEEYKALVGILRVWEGIPRRKLEETVSEIAELHDRILSTFVPCSEILEELSGNKRETLYAVDKILSFREYQHLFERDLPVLEIAKEIVQVVCVTSPVLSVSDRARKWYSKLNGAVVGKAEENRTIMKIKDGYRGKMKAAGWKGRILIWLAKHVPIPYSGDVVDAVVILFATLKTLSENNPALKYPTCIAQNR